MTGSRLLNFPRLMWLFTICLLIPSLQNLGKTIRLQVDQVDDHDLPVLSGIPRQKALLVTNLEDQLLASNAEPFKPRLNEAWCDPTDGKSGIWLSRIPKTASTVASTVTVQIARSQPSCAYARQNKFGMVHVAHWDHGRAFQKRGNSSFLWTWIRNPSSRALSAYFYSIVSQRNRTYDDRRTISDIKDLKNYMLWYNSPEPNSMNFTDYYNAADSADLLQDIKDKVLSKYQFIGVTERMEESLVVMKLLFGLRDSDIIAMPAKAAGAFDDGRHRNTCFKLKKTSVSPKVYDYLEGKFRENNFDFQYYRLVNKTLDLTIDYLGRSRVEEEILRHRELSRLAADKCAEEAVYPCIEEGVPPREESKESCFVADIGCGWRCVRREIDGLNVTTLQ